MSIEPDEPRSFWSVVQWTVAVLVLDAMFVILRPSSICSQSGETEFGTMIRWVSAALTLPVPTLVLAIRRRLTRRERRWSFVLMVLPVVGCAIVVLTTRRIPQRYCP